MQNIFTLKVGGQAGQGIKSAGMVLAKVTTRSGYHVYDYTEYPSLVRGGHNVMQIAFSLEEVTAPSSATNLLIALDQETIDRHFSELTRNSGILFSSETNLDTSKISSGINLYPIPLSSLANSAGGKELLGNSVALGATVALLGGDLKILQNLLQEEFADKDTAVILSNQKAAELGYQYVGQHLSDKIQQQLVPQNTPPLMLICGNDAVAMGAIAGGLEFAAIYPMSPISGILHNLAGHQEKYGYIFKQPEDEIAAVNMAIGASFSGARSMTATSGGGFCLMTEGYGLAGITETPLVIVDGMRPGPATGLPTWSEQGDLLFAIFAHQGDFPKIVLAPGDSKEAFFLTRQAFNLADKYQLPVVLLIDRNICEDDQSFSSFDLNGFEINRGKVTAVATPGFARYVNSPDGVSPRTFPGSGNYFMANSYEHDETGISTEKIEVRNQQMEKRMRKLQTCITEDMPAPKLFGPEKADLTIISWGSNKGSILQALKQFPNVNLLHLIWMNPFPIKTVQKILSSAVDVLDIECNQSAQLATLIKARTGFEIADKLLKYDGRPFFQEEIIAKISSMLEKKI